MATKKIKRHREVNVLESRRVESADDWIEGEHGHEVPLVVRTAYEDVKREVRRLQRHKTETPALPSRATQPATKTNGTHPAVTGLSIGGAKEVIDYIFGIGFKGDTATLGFLGLPFIDGGITALIATIAAFLAKGNKK